MTDPKQIKILRRGRIRVVLDRSKVHPDDPGAGTPAVVEWCNERGEGDYSATYWCATGEGVLDGGRKGNYTLTEKQLEWLYSLDRKITEFLYSEFIK